MKRVLLAIGIAALIGTSPLMALSATAQTLVETKAGKSYKHKESGIEFPAAIEGLPRLSVQDYSDELLNVSVDFADPDRSEIVTAFVFRATNGTVPVWFEQARWQIAHRGMFGTPVALDAPTTFTPPGGSAASALSVTYAMEGKGFRSSALRLFRVGEFYVKLRATSTALAPAELDARVVAALQAIRLPGKGLTNEPATPVAPCADRLDFSRPAELAKLSKDQRMQAQMIAGIMLSPAGDKKGKQEPAAPPLYCLDSTPLPGIGVYRDGAERDRYLLAISDAGAGMIAGPDLTNLIFAEIAQSKSEPPPAKLYGATLYLSGQTSSYPAYIALPTPDQMIALLDGAKPATVVGTWGQQRTIRITP